MPNECVVIGETAHLLVIGVDGNCYGYYPDEERVVPLDPDDQWVMLTSAEEIEEKMAVAGGESR